MPALRRARRMRRRQVLLAVAAYLLLPGIATAQGLMGALIGTVKDEQGGVLAGARVRISSPALIGGPETLITSDKGQLRFPSCLRVFTRWPSSSRDSRPITKTR